MADEGYSRPRGFFDREPAFVARRRRLEAVLLAEAEALGFSEVEVPTLEYADLYRAGSEPAELQRQLLESRISDWRSFPQDGVQVPSGEVVLRPDLTTPLARRWVEASLGPNPPAQARWVSAGQVFRNVAPTGDRPKEFRQFDVEIFGSEDPSDDAAMLAFAARAVRSAGVHHFEVRIGHGALIEAMCAAVDIEESRRVRLLRGLEWLCDDLHRAAGPPEKARRYVQDQLAAYRVRFGDPAWSGLVSGDTAELAERSRDAFDRRWFTGELSGAQEALVSAIIDTWPHPADLAALAMRHAPAEAAARFEALRTAAAATGGDVTLLARFGRGTGYYDGFTFELHAHKNAGFSGLGGGGRFDLTRLARRASEVTGRVGPPGTAWTRGVGFALKLDAMVEAGGVA